MHNSHSVLSLRPVIANRNWVALWLVGLGEVVRVHVSQVIGSSTWHFSCALIQDSRRSRVLKQNDSYGFEKVIVDVTNNFQQIFPANMY